MSTAIARLDDASVARLGGWSMDQVALLREQLAPEATLPELALLASYAKRWGLDPFTGQVHGIVRRDKRAPRGQRMTIQIGIDGFRALAEETGKLEGKFCEEWCGKDRVWVDWWDTESDGHPMAARYGVFKAGAPQPIIAVATWQEYAQYWPQSGDLMGLWGKMGPTMLAKCAEAKCYRQAFPRLSGLYVDEEMPPAIGTDNASDTDDGARSAIGVVTVETPDTPSPVQDASAVRVKDAIKELSDADKVKLRDLCRDAGADVTPAGVAALLAAEGQSLRQYLDSHTPSIASEASVSHAEASDDGTPGVPTPAGAGAPVEAPEAPTHSAEPKPAPAPIDHVSAALVALSEDDRQLARQLAYYWQWGGKTEGDDVGAADILEGVGLDDAQDVTRLSAALRALDSFRQQQLKRETDERAADEAMAKRLAADSGDADAMASWQQDEIDPDQLDLPF